MSQAYTHGQIVTIGDLLLEYTYAGWKLIAYLGKETSVVLPKTIEGKKLFAIKEYAFSPLNPHIDEAQKTFLQYHFKCIRFDQDAMESFEYFALQWHPLVFARCEALETTVPIESLDRIEMRKYPSLLYPDCPKICPTETKTGESGILSALSDAEHSVTHIVVSSAYHTVGTKVAMNTASETVYLAEGVETIEAAAFANMTNLETVHLPKSLRKVAPNAFAGCSSLSEESKKAIAPYITENPFCATIAFRRMQKETDSPIVSTDENTFTLTVSDTDASKDFVLLDLTKESATVYLVKPQKTITLSLGETVTETHREWDLGSLIEGERYYEYDETCEYTVTLLNIQ